eukprot:GHUV01018214.1.p1 GENE.GHUV01018214.1~~GHUV01018214.1.p1  ORF type:complete len:638 (+),score=155.08 GHUV01018214.1:188-2101(+)
MLETLAQEDEERSYISWPVQVVADVMGKRIKTSPNDEIGVVFYGTERRSESTEVRTFDHVYEYVKLDVPDAATIRKLQDFQDAEFQTSSGPGCGDGGATPGRAAEDLKDGLFACWDMLTRGGSSSSSSRVGKTILLFTNNQNPVSNAGANAAHLREQIIGRARELGALAVSLELIPLVQLSDPDAFDYAPFWRELLAECAAAARGLTGSIQEEAEDVASQMEEQAEGLSRKIARVQGMGYRATRKRPLASLKWGLGPDLKIGVQLFALIQPAKAPSYKYVSRDTAEPLTKSNAIIDADTGARLQGAQHKMLPQPKDANRFPKVILTKAEDKELRSIRPKGLTLLGFKPLSCLQDWHQLSPSRLVYPDERAVKGSTAAFVALHAACQPQTRHPQIAVCSFVRQTGSAPQLVALVPTLEEVDEDGLQLCPTGFQMIYLPYRDDLRQPESDPALVGKLLTDGRPAQATQEQVEAAAKLVSDISLDAPDAPFSTADIANPHLARHFEVLEALALGNEPPSLEETVDDTKPDDGIDAHAAALDAFKLAVWGSLDGPAVAEKKPATKRKAPDSHAQASLAEEYNQHNWAVLASKPDGKPGSLAKLTAPTLKVYLKYHSLPVSGNKPDLLQRIKDHIATQQGML